MSRKGGVVVESIGDISFSREQEVEGLREMGKQRPSAI